MTTLPAESHPPVAPRLTRAGTALALLLLAAVLVVAARSESEEVAPRTGRRVELVELIRAEQARTATLERDVAALTAQVAEHEQRSAVGAETLAKLQERIDRVAVPAHMTAVAGPGVEVTLSDSSLEVSPSGNLNDLVIHEQDLQAVINGLWAGGAEAMTVNNQRILATTAIRCVGNTLLLHGSVYSPPYVIRAIGDEQELNTALERDPSVSALRSAAQQYRLGFTVTAAERLELPAYEGGSTVKIATPVSKNGS